MSTSNVPVTMRLNMEPEDFAAIKDQFVLDLAKLLDVSDSDIEIIEVRRHCTDLTLTIPTDKSKLYKLLNSREKDFPAAQLEEILNFRRKYKVSLSITTAPSYLRSKDLVFAPSDEYRGLTWMHLSDSHFKAPSKEKDLDYWTQDKTRQTFIEQVSDLLANERLSPDYIFFTGDIAYSGKVQQYEVALNFLKNLQQLFMGRRKRQGIPIFCVPGNHDIDRSVVQENQSEEDKANAFLQKNPAVIQFINSSEHKSTKEMVLKRQSSYLEFSKQATELGQPYQNREYFFTTTRIHHGVTVGIAGLNSAWRSGSNEDRGKLILGVPQLDTAISDLRTSDIRILLIHHPPESDWFLSDDMFYQREQLRHFDFVIRGHDHDPHTVQRSLPGRSGFSHISAGALYTSDYPSSFNVVNLDFDECVAFVFFWRLSEKTYKWVKDTEVYPNGYTIFELSKDLAWRLRNCMARANRRRKKLTSLHG